MTGQSPTFAAALVVAAVLAIALALVAWQRRATPGGAAFAWLMVAVAEWALMSALEKVVIGIPGRVLCAKIEYLGVASVPVLWLLFALGYSQPDRRLTRRSTAPLWIMPVLTIGLAATNERHGLVWTQIVPSSDSPGAPLVYAHGAWFWIFAVYNYALIAVGTVALVWAVLRFRRTYRYQAIALLIGLAFPWVTNAIYLSGLSPLAGVDPTPFAFTLTGAVFAWALFRFRLLDLVPVARDTVIEGMSDGVIVLDAHNRVADINPAAQRLVVGAGEPPIGQRAEMVLAPWPDLVRCLGSKREAQTEVCFRGDVVRDFDVRIALLRDGHGSVTGRLILLRDITERKQVEEMREDLTHALVHDLRNPLTSIHGSLDMLAQEEAVVCSSVQREMVDMARANVERMLGLIEGILDVGRLESGQLVLDREPRQLGPLVAEVLQLQASLATERRVQLLNAVPADLPPVLVDARLTTRVLQNLIDNAIKFTPKGGTIRVAARNAPGPTHLLISVSDDGPGIAADIRERVFDKFVSGRVPGRGTGLGLAFCRLAVEAHGGRIWVDGDGGRGTTVAFTLPLAS